MSKLKIYKGRSRKLTHGHDGVMVLFEKGGVFIHTAVQNNDEDTLIGGKLLLLQKREGIFIEWKPAEDYLEIQPSAQGGAAGGQGAGGSDAEWAMIDAVGYKNDKSGGTGAVSMQPKKQPERHKYIINFDIKDLKSFKRSGPNLGWPYLIFILKDGTTYPALQFHVGGSKSFVRELERYLTIKKKATPPTSPHSLSIHNGEESESDQSLQSGTFPVKLKEPSRVDVPQSANTKVEPQLQTKRKGSVPKSQDNRGSETPSSTTNKLASLLRSASRGSASSTSKSRFERGVPRSGSFRARSGSRGASVPWTGASRSWQQKRESAKEKDNAKNNSKPDKVGQGQKPSRTPSSKPTRAAHGMRSPKSSTMTQMQQLMATYGLVSRRMTESQAKNTEGCPTDSKLYLVREHDPAALSRSFDELQLFAEQSGDLVSRFITDPYTTTLGGFSKVTNFLKDRLLVPDTPMRPEDEVAEILQEDIPGVDINNQEEPGFELITKTVELPERPEVKRSDPLTPQAWSKHMDAEGRVIDVDRLKQAIFHGGVDATIRIEVWKFLLGYYKWDSTYKSRTEERKKKVDDYFRMKLQWKSVNAEQEKRFSILKERKSLIDKDVTRTDRTHQFFQGEENPNLTVLYDILMTYCMYNFDLGYVQGMSDLLAPILVVMENEVDAFWCFAGFMEIVGHNFEMNQEGMKTQLHQLHTLVKFLDPQLCNYLDSHDSSNMYFCFRWLLIIFKREFAFPDIMRLWEVYWTGLPCKNFHLLVCMAILDTEKNTLIENNFGFTEILKHINDMSGAIELEENMRKAEAIYLQIQQCKKLPPSIMDIFELNRHPSTPASSSSASTPTEPEQPPAFGEVDRPKLHFPMKIDDGSKAMSSSGHTSEGGTAVTTPDDSSIEILPDVDNAFVI